MFGGKGGTRDVYSESASLGTRPRTFSSVSVFRRPVRVSL